MPNDVSAFITPVRDLNDEPCALVKVEAPSDFAFSTPLGIVSRKDKVGEIWLYLPKGSKLLTIKHPEWGVLRDYRFSKPLESRMTYELKLKLPKPTPIIQEKHDTIVEVKTVIDTIAIPQVRKKMPLALYTLATLSLHEDGPSYGLFFALMHRHGFFIHASSNLKSIGSLGPDSLMEYDTVNDITDSQDTSGEEIAQEENESGITIEEAGNMIDSFLKETGFSSIPQTESSQLKWSGYNERADHVYQEDDIHECVSGYRFYYNIGVGKILFDDALNPMDYSGYNMKYGDSIEDTFDNEFYNFYIDKYGIGTFFIDCPVSIVRKQENVEMLPLENIFDIARDELKNNADEYVLDTNVKYYTLKLAYIRVNNRTDMQKYSYIPAWSLELLQKDTTNACPVFINAIDGSVIHPDDLS